MNFNIKATNTTITPAIRSQIEEKVQNLEKLLKPEDRIDVEIEIDQHHMEGGQARVEIRVSPRGEYAEARGDDFYSALDLVLPKIREQLTKQKDKRISLRRRLGAIFKRNR